VAVDFDLLGDPISPNRGEPGRPIRVATSQEVSKVRVLLRAGLGKKRIADEIGVSLPVLNRLFFASGKVSYRHARAAAIAEARAKTLLQLEAAADGGNVSAMKAQLKAQEAELRDLVDGEVAAGRGGNPGATKAPRPMPAGKKEAARAAAMVVEDELDDMFGKGAPRH
jgi:hypothetical protein